MRKNEIVRLQFTFETRKGEPQAETPKTLVLSPELSTVFIDIWRKEVMRGP